MPAFARFALLFAIYAGTAKLGLSLDAIGGFATLVWPPTGIAFAALFLFGKRLWPAIALGAFVVNVATGAPIAAAGGIAIGNALEAVIAVALVEKLGVDPALCRVRDVLALALGAAGASTLISATIGVASLWAGGVVHAGALGHTWIAWWIGDGLGDLIAAPFLLVWWRGPRPIARRSELVEAIALIAILVIISLYVFGAILPRPQDAMRWPYLVFPVLIWASLRFRQLGATTGTLVVSITSIAMTVLAVGPFTAGGLSETLLPLQIFMAVVAITMLLLGAAVCERDRASRLRDEALDRAETAERRARFLADASELMASGLDYQRAMTAVARHAVPVLGDRCTVDVIDNAGTLHRVAEVGPALAAAASTVSVPLAARDRVLGAISFELAARAHTAADRTLAEELAARASIAIDNATLYDEAQHAIRARDEFLAIASHELRTPLTTLGLQVSNLCDAASKEVLAPAKLVAKLQIIERQGERLGALVENLLDVSRVMASRLELVHEPVDLTDIVREVAARFREHAARAGCELTVELDRAAPLVGDRLRLEQIVTNLLSNAVKFGAGTPIHVSLTAAQAAIELRVRDEGVGIAAADQARIFERFERATTRRGPGGLGLGLWIVHQIVSAMNGSIRVASEPGHGAEFVVTLPR